MLDDGVHDRPSADAELVGELALRSGILTRLAAPLDAGAASQHRLVSTIS
jgi:hypothetical protein